MTILSVGDWLVCILYDGRLIALTDRAFGELAQTFSSLAFAAPRRRALVHPTNGSAVSPIL
jgi:hypothetical protein